MLIALLAWVWAWVGPLVWAAWGVVALALDLLLKSCGMVLIYERLGRWWNGE